MTARPVVTRRSRRAWLLGSAFFSDPSRHRLRARGDVVAGRNALRGASFNNLEYLLCRRYEWMNSWIANGDIVVEIGAGAGLAPRYLAAKPILTDVIVNAWLDAVVDGTALAFRDESVDVVIASNALHHFASPVLFLNEATRILKPGGLILLNEAYCSLLLRVLLRVAQHEGYSYEVDVFDPAAVANDPQDPWSGNNAVSNLLFDDKAEFATHFSDLRVVSDTPCEALLFILSGGVTAKIPVPELPTRLLDCIAALDRLAVAVAAPLFALSRQTVLRKTRRADAADGAGDRPSGRP
jgi:SAM-dependent methyltransferase